MLTFLVDLKGHDIAPFLLPPLGRVTQTPELSNGGIERGEEPRPWRNHLGTWPILTMRAIDYLGISASLVESDLHIRFPGVFPKFWYKPDSAPFIVLGDAESTENGYKYLEIPCEAYIDPADITADPESGQDETSSIHATSRPSSPPKTITIGVATLIHDAAELSVSLDLLKEANHSATELNGFVIATLGGTLHLSYPPTLEETKLYCKVISMADSLSPDYVHKLPGMFATLHSSITSLSLPQPVPITPSDTMLSDLCLYIWKYCDQNSRCLALLAPLLCREDLRALISGLGDLACLNPDQLITLIRSAPTGYTGDYSVPLPEAVDRNTQNCPCKLKEREPKRAFVFPPTSSVATVDEHLGHYRRSRTFRHLGVDRSWFQPYLLKEVIPEGLLSLVSQPGVEGKKTLFLAQTSILVERWPYFAKLMDSGLSEALTRVIGLPFSAKVIDTILDMLYRNTSEPRRKLAREDVAELIAQGPAFGLVPPIQRDVPLTPIEKVSLCILLGAEEHRLEFKA